jgi:hypothetical protein
MKKLLSLFILSIFIISCSPEEPCEPTPKLTTSEATEITDVSAIVTGTITPPTCDETVTSQGFVYGESELPTIDDTKIVKSGSEVSVSLNNLQQNNTYYIRTFFENPTGVYYGNEVVFSTAVGDAVVQTGEINEDYIYTDSLYSISGAVISTGGVPILSVGFCYSTDSNPTIDNNTIESENVSEQFSASIDNLTQNTTYYIKAYVETEKGIFYGNELSFQTLCVTPSRMHTTSSATITESNHILFNVSYEITTDVINWEKAYIEIDAYRYSENFNNPVASVEISSLSGEVDILYDGINLKQLYEENGNLDELEFSAYVNLDFYDSCADSMSPIAISEDIIEITPKYEVGDKAQGGVIIALFDNYGLGGLVVAENDAGKAAWACDSTNEDWGWLPLNQGGLGDGEYSSQAIYNFITQGTGKSFDGYFANFCGGDCPYEPSAVELCYNYVVDGYDDWFLPTTLTLEYIYYQVLDGNINVGNFVDSGCGTSEKMYVSSNASGANAGTVNFITTGNYSGYVGKGSFGNIYNVRPVRRF